MNTRKYIQQSGLFLESVEKISQELTSNFYCGFNVTKTNKEPIDQLQSFIVAKRIQDCNFINTGNKGIFISFIGGLFEVLNCKDISEVNQLTEINRPKEESKKKLYQKIYDFYGLEGKILTTEDLWKDQKYWDILKNLFDKQVFTRGLLINDTLNFYESKDQLLSGLKVKDLPSSIVNLPLEFVKKIGNYPAPILYTPAEVSEAYYLQEKYGVTTKIGQAQERPYDKYLYSEFSVYRFKQPVGLNSTLNKPETVTPYIDKSNFEISGMTKTDTRIYFDDTIEQISQKVSTCNDNNYIFATDGNFGEVLSPIIEKAVFAIESGIALGNKSIEINGVDLFSGQDLIDNVLENKISIENIKTNLAVLIDKYVTKPFNSIL